MLRIINISKRYKTGGFVQNALDGVSLNLRDSEFVAVLGPSGSGKTTLLNMIGGLDRYDGGNLIINGVSTEKYKDRDWDSYRNHTVGFVFQSYNLIPHQSVLSNVELALTISGISRSERRKRAKKALSDVGLSDQIHKKPNQLSGGQMQRVAIARALVNDPEILLADEPTGALDSETSYAVMELLKQVAEDHLVVMVTHNPELAERYATRTVNLRDGKVVGDTDPYYPDTEALPEPSHKNMGRASMSFLTALSLSFKNLLTKKGRTVLTAFAGSIGIIGIALILSLSNGVNNYITDIQKSTMSSYPITIDKQAIDLNGVIASSASAAEEHAHEDDAVYSNGAMLTAASTLTSSVTENDLRSFKKYLDDEKSPIHEFVGENGIVYGYDTVFGVYTYEPDGSVINTTDTSESSSSYLISSSMMPTTYSQLLPSPDGMVGSAITSSFDIIGSWPTAYDEVVLFLDEHNEMQYRTLYRLGFIAESEYKDILSKIQKGEPVEVPQHRYSYEEIMGKDLRLITAAGRYMKAENGTFYRPDRITEDFKTLYDGALKLKIVGIAKPNGSTTGVTVTSAVGYTKALTDYIMESTNKSEIVTAQRENPNVNVISGLTFTPANDEDKKTDAIKYVEGLGVSAKAKLCRELFMTGAVSFTDLTETDIDMARLIELSSSISGTGTASETDLAAMLDLIMESPPDSMLITVYDQYVSSGSYDDNMNLFGVVDPELPSSINIYTDTFENKDRITEAITAYNGTVPEESRIVYTDYVGLLMSSITIIINVISYILIAFVGVSLVVSSIMIGIITYISVLERTKEIGILRAIGASKRNISQVFNAETFIIGLFAGIIGVGISLLLLLPANALIHYFANAYDINASLPPLGAAVLVLLSVGLTLLGGLIPANKASRKDPVSALRTE